MRGKVTATQSNFPFYRSIIYLVCPAAFFTDQILFHRRYRGHSVTLHGRHKRYIFTFQKCTGQIENKMPLTINEGRANYTLECLIYIPMKIWTWNVSAKSWNSRLKQNVYADLNYRILTDRDVILMKNEKKKYISIFLSSYVPLEAGRLIVDQLTDV